jgi:transposase
VTNNALDCPNYWPKEAGHTVCRGEVWTCERVAIVIRKEFGVSYHPAHVSRVVRALGLSLQKPQRRAEERDEEAIEHWKEDKWPSLKKGR